MICYICHFEDAKIQKKYDMKKLFCHIGQNSYFCILK